MKQYGLVLGGGAARGLAHIGVIKYIEKNQIQISEVSGTSMGAVIGALFAMGKNYAQITKIAEELSFMKLLDPDFKTGLLKGKKIEEKLFEFFGDTCIEDSKIPLKIVATNIETNGSRIFTSGKIIEALRASISLPGVFTPKKIDGESYVDGGIMMNLPIQVLKEKNIIAVSALKINYGKIEQTKTVMGLDFKSGFFKNNFEIIKRSVILLMKVNEDMSLATADKNVILLRPDFGKLDVADFNKVDEFIKIGHTEAVNKLSKLKK